MKEKKKDFRNYGHAPAEALFPLFKSDYEYELIKAVLNERFPTVSKEAIIMYKYLASQHLPKIILFSYDYPEGIIIKRLTPEKAWNEYAFSRIWSILHLFDFNVIYHQDLGCISERYLAGYDVIQLPDDFLSNEDYVEKIFFWMGKCAAVAYIFGLGDRGHNERFICPEQIRTFNILKLDVFSEPIVNIDFEDFPSKRLFYPIIDATEIALLYYSLYIQLSDTLRKDYISYCKYFDLGFEVKLYETRKFWPKTFKIIKKELLDLFDNSPRENPNEIISKINERALEENPEDVLAMAFEVIQNDIKKGLRQKSGSLETALKDKGRKKQFEN
ncbi:MAG: hypothetical protein ACTSR8_01580 [Promethearchaeota archaeon]